MDFFINSAWAQAGGPASPFTQFLPLIVIFALFYFLLIRPQRKRDKELQKMRQELAAGQEVITGGGVLGKVTSVRDDWVTVEVADGISIKVSRGTTAAGLPPGTIKSS